MPRVLDRRIADITGEPGEWFVYLKPGYAVADVIAILCIGGTITWVLALLH